MSAVEQSALSRGADAVVRPRVTRVVSRIRLSMTVLVTIAVVVAEFTLLHVVYHQGDAIRQASWTTARLTGRVASATPSHYERVAEAAQTELRSLPVSGSDVQAAQQAAHTFREAPDRATLDELRTAMGTLNNRLAADTRHDGTRADLIYVLLLVVASLGWMVWFRRLVARHRGLQQIVTEAQATAHAEQRLAAMVRNSADLVILCGLDGVITFATPSSRSILGVEPDALVGCDFLTLVEPDDRENMAVALGTLGQDEDREIGVRMGHPDGRVLHVEGTITDLSQDPTVAALLITVRDVTTRVDLETQLRFQAFYDPLTGLANRLLFSERLTHALARRGPDARANIAVLFCDLDEFKNINDSLGHRIGDLVLVEVSRRAGTIVGVADTVARLGGDEFAILLENSDLASATRVAEALLACLGLPVEVDGHILNVRASVGLAMADNNSATGEEILRNADVAMYLAKERGKGTFAAYDVELHTMQLDRLSLIADLENAIDCDELLVYYQPIVDLRDRSIAGFEALVRWQHPVRGLLGPALFVPVAEKTGMIHEVGRAVLRTACRAGVEFTSFAARPIYVSVNVAPAQLTRSDFVSEVTDALQHSGLPGSQLIIEITETALLSDWQQTVEHLGSLRQLGVRIAIDDFGTGYSSLAYLRDLPLDILKVDKAFIDRAAENASDASLTEAILGMSRSMSLATVAEGVEHEEQADWLTGAGCSYGQGFLWSRPVPQTDAVELILPAAERNQRLSPPHRAVV